MPVVPTTPPGFATINPFIVTRDADGLIRFLTTVFDGVERLDARTIDDDGLLLHAELQIGGTTVMFAERKPGWPFTPVLLQIYVDDVEVVLGRAVAAGAEIITRPTDFFGDVLSRFLDPWRNLWWVYQHGGADAETGWTESVDASPGWEPTPELSYIHDTLLAALPRVCDAQQ